MALRAAEGVIALGDLLAEHLLLGGRVAPRPAEPRPDRVLLVELQRGRVLGRAGIGRRVGIRPEGASREQPHGAVEGRRVALRRERGPRVAVEFPALRETRSEEHTSELQSLAYLVCRLLLE